MLFGWVLTPDEMALLTVVASILLALLLTFFLRCWIKSAQACVLGLGLAPLAIFRRIQFCLFFSSEALSRTPQIAIMGGIFGHSDIHCTQLSSEFFDFDPHNYGQCDGVEFL